MALAEENRHGGRATQAAQAPRPPAVAPSRSRRGARAFRRGRSTGPRFGRGRARLGGAIGCRVGGEHRARRCADHVGREQALRTPARASDRASAGPTGGRGGDGRASTTPRAAGRARAHPPPRRAQGEGPVDEFGLACGVARWRDCARGVARERSRPGCPGPATCVRALPCAAVRVRPPAAPWSAGRPLRQPPGRALPGSAGPRRWSAGRTGRRSARARRRASAGGAGRRGPAATPPGSRSPLRDRAARRSHSRRSRPRARTAGRRGPRGPPATPVYALYRTFTGQVPARRSAAAANA